MLTKSDLSQIRTVVRDEVGSVVDERLEVKLEQNLNPIKKDLNSLRKDMNYLKRKVNRIDKTVNLIVKNFDEGDVKLDRRVRKTEEHLDLPTAY